MKTQPNPADGCPVCGGKLWDNRDSKKNVRAPDYKCRDKACEGCIWPLKDGETYAAPKGGAPAPVAAPRAAAPAAKQPHTAGPYIPEIDAEHPALPHEKLDTIFAVYRTCFKEAHREAITAFGNDVSDQTVAAMTATLLIAAQKAGVC